MAHREFELLTLDAQAALRQFDTSFMMALSEAPEAWAKSLGAVKSSGMSKVTWPIPLSAAGYTALAGDLKYRKLAEKSFSLTPQTYQDGVSELASVVEAPDFYGWNDEPARIAMDAVALPNRLVATLLAAGEATDCWDGMYFFDTGHPCNAADPSVTTTFDNYHASRALTSDNFQTALKEMRSIKGPSGKALGLRVTHLLVPASLEQDAKKIINQSIVVQSPDSGTTFGAVDNIWKGAAEVIVGDELEDGYWYAISANRPGMRPWAILDGGAPETIISDKSSHLYQSQLKVGYASIVRCEAGLAMPQCIHRYKTTA